MKRELAIVMPVFNEAEGIEEFINEIKSSLPVMPDEWRNRLFSLGLSRSQIDTLLEAEIDNEAVDYLPIIEDNLDNPDVAKFIANYFVNIEIPMRHDGSVSDKLDNHARSTIYIAIDKLIQENKLSSTNAKALLTQLLKEGLSPTDIEGYAGEQGYIQESDSSEIEKIVEAVIAEFPDAANDVKNGEMKAIGFLTGQVMKKSLGKANPGMAQELIRKKLA